MDNGDRPPQNWFNAQIERRLDQIQVNTESIWRELRDEVRRVDGHANTVKYVEAKVEDVKKDIEAIRKQIRDEVLTRDDFRPYKNGLVLVISTVGVAVLGAVLKMVIGPQ